MKTQFEAQLWKIQRDHEDETKITFCCDASQLDKINEIPTQALLRVEVESE